MVFSVSVSRKGVVLSVSVSRKGVVEQSARNRCTWKPVFKMFRVRFLHVLRWNDDVFLERRSEPGSGG